MVLKLVPKKIGRGDAVTTEKIEKDPAARIQRSALKKRTQLHPGTLKMIIPHSNSNKYIHHKSLHVFAPRLGTECCNF